mmetsp:Transcript_64614/g.154244  ORF Transcript_64614/g.154244 Transcript_64614/m.154244 type:complete len:215 (-) Transcript_64614:69-713(-)
MGLEPHAAFVLQTTHIVLQRGLLLDSIAIVVAQILLRRFLQALDAFQLLARGVEVLELGHRMRDALRLAHTDQHQLQPLHQLRLLLRLGAGPARRELLLQRRPLLDRQTALVDQLLDGGAQRLDLLLQIRAVVLVDELMLLALHLALHLANGLHHVQLVLCGLHLPHKVLEPVQQPLLLGVPGHVQVNGFGEVLQLHVLGSDRLEVPVMKDLKI